ncbi:hypothetical protein R1T40_07900 [Tritonibacter scottomollicae]|uniref:Uncharacterized protein n=1 Tax=Tritonibacter scottomollicae TaxID=483013 RepID=A0ABZ0HKH5_TRISK|nr:hypothetical protein [Tritonibacter scottomollicae]WOI34639.1 hypothetical protein R1T40_07900 [Tritonibacter scottomollicae]
MRHFDEIFAIPVARHCDPAALKGRRAQPMSQIAARPKDRWPPVVSLCAVNAGCDRQVTDTPAAIKEPMQMRPDACASWAAQSDQSLPRGSRVRAFSV